VKPIVVVHDAGVTGAPWRDALRGWDGEWAAPDLVIKGASGDRTDVVWLVLEQMETWRDRDAVIVGCGEYALAAETFAFAGWVGGLVLVDGLGGEWSDPEQQIAAQNEWLRTKFHDPAHVGYPQAWVEPFARVLRGEVRCPVLLIETPASITPPSEVEQRAQQFSRPAEVVRLEASDPMGVVAAIEAWVGS
jgi:hypothetical protein